MEKGVPDRFLGGKGVSEGLPKKERGSERFLRGKGVPESFLWEKGCGKGSSRRKRGS